MAHDRHAALAWVWVGCLPLLASGCLAPEPLLLPPELASQKSVLVLVVSDDTIRDGVAFDPRASRPLGFHEHKPLLALGYDYELEDLQIPEQLPVVSPTRPLPNPSSVVYRYDPEGGTWLEARERAPRAAALKPFDYGRCLEHGRCTHPKVEPFELCTPCEPPTPLEPPAPPQLAPCAHPWIEDQALLDEDGVHGCLWPHQSCTGDAVRPWPYLEADACGPPLPSCGDETWPDLPPDTSPNDVIYVAATAGLSAPDGRPPQPTLVDANELVPPGGVIALSKGQHDSTNVFIRRDVRVIGPCARTTTVTMGDPTGDRLAFFDGENAVEGLRLEGRLWAQRGHLSVKNLRILSPTGAITALEGARLDVDGVYISAPEDGVVAIQQSTAHIAGAVIEGARFNSLRCEDSRVEILNSYVRAAENGLNTRSCTISVDRSLFEDLARAVYMGPGSVGHVADTVIRRGRAAPNPSGIEIADSSIDVSATSIEDVFSVGVRIVSSTSASARFSPHTVRLRDLRIEDIARGPNGVVDGSAVANISEKLWSRSGTAPQFVAQRVLMLRSAGPTFVSNSQVRALFEDLVAVDGGPEGNCVSFESGVGPFMLSRAYLRCGLQAVFYLLHDDELRPASTTTISDAQIMGGDYGMRIELREPLFVARTRVEGARRTGILLPSQRSDAFERQRFEDIDLISGSAPWNNALEASSPGVELHRFRVRGGSIGLSFKASLEDMDGRRVSANDGEVSQVGTGVSVGSNDPAWFHEVLYRVHVTPVAGGSYVVAPKP